VARLYLTLRQPARLARTAPEGFNVGNLRIDVAPTPRYLGA
jgi:hypothetical protein